MREPLRQLLLVFDCLKLGVPFVDAAAVDKMGSKRTFAAGDTEVRFRPDAIISSRQVYKTVAWAFVTPTWWRAVIGGT
ncbi:hypothetical protein [Nitratireductor soli]|uniref:hypothetical protein n=1 Tax=Nitratireductor soli TaxID=1670619 RepID=UPI0012F8E172|nr:hypothetical protein [Nitratireductor soli]